MDHQESFFKTQEHIALGDINGLWSVLKDAPKLASDKGELLLLCLVSPENELPSLLVSGRRGDLQLRHENHKEMVGILAAVGADVAPLRKLSLVRSAASLQSCTYSKRFHALRGTADASETSWLALRSGGMKWIRCTADWQRMMIMPSRHQLRSVVHDGGTHHQYEH